jgi:Raf kinase inhibitor-like YbhB/YbcL family protein
MKRLLALCLAAMPLMGITTASATRTRLRLTSPAFEAGRTIPDGFTCDGAGANPPLRWRGTPKGTVELALIVEDPDAPGGTFVHWVAYRIDPDLRALPEDSVPAGVAQGANGVGEPGYLPPCPPAGDDPHRYRFTLYALDAPMVLDLFPTAENLRDAIRSSVIARTRLVGRYGR